MFGGCLSWAGNDSSVDSYVTLLNRSPDDVEIEVTVHDDSTDTRVVDEGVTIPAEERYRTEFTVHLEEAGDSADVRAAVRNVGRGPKIAWLGKPRSSKTEVRISGSQGISTKVVASR